MRNVFVLFLLLVSSTAWAESFPPKQLLQSIIKQDMLDTNYLNLPEQKKSFEESPKDFFEIKLVDLNGDGIKDWIILNSHTEQHHLCSARNCTLRIYLVQKESSDLILEESVGDYKVLNQTSNRFKKIEARETMGANEVYVKQYQYKDKKYSAIECKIETQTENGKILSKKENCEKVN